MFHPLTAADGTQFLRVVTDSRPNLVIAGDSHMEMYLRRAVKLARETGVNFENNTISSCFIFGETHSIHEGDECREDQKQFAKLLADGAVKNIAIAEKWGGYQEKYPALFQRGLTGFAKYLDEHPDVNVWIILDPPWEELPDNSKGEGAYDPRKHASRFHLESGDLWFRYPHDKRWINGNNAVRAILGDRVRYIETEPYVCRDGQCNLKYYLNDDHLQTDFTEEHAVWIDPIFEAVAAQ